MRFSIDYHSAHKTTADEIRCPFNQLGRIYDFMKEVPDKRYNITVPTEVEDEAKARLDEQINLVKNVATDFTIECGDPIILQTMLDKGYPAYLKYPITDWQGIHNLCRIGVSDIVIDGPVCFDCLGLESLCGSVNLRISPVVSENSFMINREIESFFVRPEDLKLFESLNPIIDFREDNLDREDALYSIYRRGSFNFDISELVEGLPKINNLLFRSEFAYTRCNCKQQCMIPNRSCNFCKHYFSVLDKSVRLAKME